MLRLRGYGISGGNCLDVRRSGGILYSVGVFSRYLRTELFKAFIKSHSILPCCLGMLVILCLNATQDLRWYVLLTLIPPSPRVA